MNIEVLLTEAEIADEFAESFEARDLPEKFFYWSNPSVKAWRRWPPVPKSNCAEHGSRWPRKPPI